MRSPYKFSLAMLLAATLAACTLTGVVYNNAVPLASWYVDDYFELQDEQRDFARERLARIHAWHRSSELPEYQRVLEQAIKRSAGPVSGDDVEQLYRQGKTLVLRAGEYALGDVADFLLKLDTQQIQAFELRLAKANQKFERERLKESVEKRVELRAKRYIKTMEDWLGTLSSEQKQHIEITLRDMPLTDGARLAERKRLQGELVADLKAGSAREELMVLLRVTFLVPDASRNPAYRAEVARWQRAMSELVAWLVDNASPQQRQHLQTKLRGYAEDVVALQQKH